MTIKPLICFLALAFLAACNQTTYHATDSGAGPRLSGAGEAETAAPLSRSVQYHLDGDFYREAPNCVAVLPSLGLENPVAARLTAKSLAQRLVAKVDRVMTPLKVKRKARALALDLDHEGDRRLFALKTRCPFYARARVLAWSDDFALFWTERQVGLALELFRASDDKPLWRAAHLARRGDGGAPLSLIGAASSVVSAGAEYADQEVLASLVDDAYRRMMMTLPDVR